jgi:hypothetical protein
VAAVWRLRLSIIAMAVTGVAAAARPAAAAMTVTFRDGRGQTTTYYVEGSHIRIFNPTGRDPGEISIVDLETKQHVIVYDTVKAYFDFNKAPSEVVARSIMQKAIKAAERSLRRSAATPTPTSKYRALGQRRTINGFSCAMYERLVDEEVEDEICFAPWGGAVGKPADFEWLDDFVDLMASELTGSDQRVARSRDEAPGLAIWTSSIEDDGTRDLLEIVKLNRDPLPPVIFTIPADYKQISRPLSASERTPAAPAILDETSWRTAAGAPSSSARRGTALPDGITGRVAGLLAIVLIIGLLLHATVLHLAAHLIIEDARFTQALIAAAIVWVVLVAARLLGLPPAVGLGVVALAAFAGLKIAYGAGIARTLALFALSAAIAALASAAAAHVLPLLAGR